MTTRRKLTGPPRLAKGSAVKLNQRGVDCYGSKYEGVTGTVAGYRMGAQDPFVDFPKHGRFKASRLYEVSTEYLERIASSAPSAHTSTRT
ncbi:Uncharacterised protein [Achromobacter sp. 2789STDY5608633]|jgi:hypothetical protein|nr:Uncharacterised protein [Achromobacter sp. 2789STDY5608633]